MDVSPTDIDMIRQLIPMWYAQRAWAEELLKRAFSLERAEDILGRELKGRRQVPGTNWTFRTHGVGVDVYKARDVGGIDFDFDKPHPDSWRLNILFERLYNDGQLSVEQYRHLHEDEDLRQAVISEALKN